MGQVEENDAQRAGHFSMLRLKTHTIWVRFRRFLGNTVPIDVLSNEAIEPVETMVFRVGEHLVLGPHCDYPSRMVEQSVFVVHIHLNVLSLP